MSKSIIVLVVDHDTFASEEPGETFTRDRLIEQGVIVNNDAASILGYEAWIVVHDAPQDLLDRLGELNIPITAADRARLES